MISVSNKILGVDILNNSLNVTICVLWWLTQSVLVSYTHTGLIIKNNASSQIDHIIIASDYKSIATDCLVFDDDSLNSSDHVPIMCNINVNIPYYSQYTRKSYNWSKGNIYAYTQYIRDQLMNSVFNDVSCTTDIDIC